MSKTYRKDDTFPSLKHNGIINGSDSNTKKISFLENVEYELENNNDEPNYMSSSAFKRPLSVQSVSSSESSFDYSRSQRQNVQSYEELGSHQNGQSRHNYHASADNSYSHQRNEGWTNQNSSGRLFNSFNGNGLKNSGHFNDTNPVSFASRDDDHGSNKISRNMLKGKETHYRELAEKLSGDLAEANESKASLEEELHKQQDKCDGYQQQLSSAQGSLKSSRLEFARQNAYIQSFDARIKDAEEMILVKDNALNEADRIVSSLKSELEMEKGRADKVESSLKLHLSMEGKAAKKAEYFENKHKQLCTELCNIFSMGSPRESSAIENTVIDKVSSLYREYETMCRDLEQLTFQTKNNDLEVKANRETIMRLVNDAENKQNETSSYIEQLRTITSERELYSHKVKDLSYEVEKLKEQLTQSQDAWTRLQKESLEKNQEHSDMKREYKFMEQQQQQTQSKMKHFKKDLINILKDGNYIINQDDRSEEFILNSLSKMIKENNNAKETDERMQARLHNLADELNNQRTAQKITIQRANEVESQWGQLNDRIKGLEGDLLASDLERDKLKEERKRYLLFLDNLAVSMKLDEIAMGSGFDVSAQALIARAEQLTNQQTESLQHRSSTIYNLQRKLKAMKQQQESKELHLNLLQRKVDKLESDARERQSQDADVESVLEKNKKMKKFCDKLQNDLKHYKMLVNESKNISESSDELKNKIVEQRQLIEDLEGMINKLSKNKTKKSKQLAAVQHELEKTEGEVSRNETKLAESLHQLSTELQSTKSSLMEAKSRERQLVDFRDVVAKVIGLDVKSLSVPDFEIISRLERIVQSHHARTIVNARGSYKEETQTRHQYSDYPKEAPVRTSSPRRPKSAHLSTS